MILAVVISGVFPVSQGALGAEGDDWLADYFAAETDRLQRRCLESVNEWGDWEEQRGEARRRLREMLGLEPEPPRTDLRAEITGTIERPDFRVENLHFQSLPGLYVTANLYLPTGPDAPAPAVLYVCGHADPMKDGVSYGNKTAYHHHGVWFARNGYVCLVIDTVERGEIRGIHHGTYRYDMWWWNSRGYTPGGVEAWNSIRALDYLETRSEVDRRRIGITGRSGGGAYSWYVAALDDRIRAAAPVAGITDLQNHVVDGVVEGHCDCMYFVNTYQWDYPMLAALVAPRPLMLANSDRDSIFPLDGVMRTYRKVRRLYELAGKAEDFGLVITPGPHRDTQDLQVPVFHWFNRYLKGEEPLIETAATKEFSMEELKVFQEVPVPNLNSNIHEFFVPKADPEVPSSASEWTRMKGSWRSALREEVFRSWPDPVPASHLEVLGEGKGTEIQWRLARFLDRSDFPLYLLNLSRTRVDAAEERSFAVLGGDEWNALRLVIHQAWPELVWPEGLSSGSERTDAEEPDGEAVKWIRELVEEIRSGTAVTFFIPRGIGFSAWTSDPRERVHIRRRFMLLGQTLDGMRVWDIVNGLALERGWMAESSKGVVLHARGAMAVNALYASLFVAGIERLELARLPRGHRTSVDYLNILKYMDIPQALAMAVERQAVRLIQPDPAVWDYAQATGEVLEWKPDRLQQVHPREGHPL